MPERAFDAVIFDMDGVLIDTSGTYERHWREWAVRHGIDTEAPIAVHHGRPAAETISLVSPDLDARDEAIDFNARLARDQDAAGVTALEGAVTLSRALPAGSWAIATSAPRLMAERWLAHVAISVPAVLVTADDVSQGKPAPEPYLRAAGLLGVTPERCLVIEDAPAGISSAKAAGATVLAVMTTHGLGDLGLADDHVRSLLDVSMAIVGQAVIVRWEKGPSR